MKKRSFGGGKFGGKLMKLMNNGREHIHFPDLVICLGTTREKRKHQE